MPGQAGHDVGRRGVIRQNVPSFPDSVAALCNPRPFRIPSLRFAILVLSGFRRYALQSSSFSDSVAALCNPRPFRIPSLRSGIPLRLRRGGAKRECKEKSSSPLDFFLCISFAERTGFEPVSRFRRLHAFQACLFSHSSIFPLRLQR